MSEPTTIAQLITALADDDRPGLRFEDREWSWREVVEESRRRGELARGLHSDGPLHVGLLLDNTPEFVFWTLGLAAVGGTVVGLNSTRRGADLERDIRFTDCALVVTEQAHRLLLDGLDVPGGRPVDVDAEGYAATLPPAPDPAEAAARAAAVPPDATITLVFTSGTTSAPKAVVCSHRRLLGLARAQIARRPLSADDVFYIAMPLFHSNSLMAALAPAVVLGACVALRRKFSASGFLADVRAFRATCFNYVGKPLRYILATPEGEDDADNPLRLAFGNEADQRDVRRFAERFGCQVQEQYGSSEGGVRIAPVPDMPPGSMGRADDGTVVMNAATLEECPPARFDAEGRLLNAGEAIGEIVGLHSAGQFEGYYKNPEADAQRRRHGMLWTGDLAYRDEQGFWYFAGRTDDWLRVDGENLAAAPIERLLTRHPAIAHAAVYAVPDPDGGDQVVAALELTPGGAFDPDDFGRFLDEQPDFGTKWAPRYIRLVEVLPKTATNKIIKTSLRAEGVQCADPLWIRHGRAHVFEPLTGDRPT